MLATSVEKTIGIDLLESLQGHNEDKSRSGNLQILKRDWNRLGVDLDFFEPFIASSLNLQAEELERRSITSIKLFSVDRGHSCNAAINNLLIASKTIDELDVVAVDDEFGNTNQWAGVTDALVWFLYSQMDIVPFFLSSGKLNLCLGSGHQ